MKDVLSQQEIDQLLASIQSGEVPVDQLIQQGTQKHKEVQLYDFRRPNRLSKNQLRTIQTLHENFSESLSYYLVSQLQTVVTINVISVDQLFYSEYILSVSSPSCLYVFDVVGTEGSGILELSPQLALAIIARLLGGDIEITRSPRVLSAIEQTILRNVVDQIMRQLSETWQVIYPLKFRLDRYESEADFVQIAPSSEIVIVVVFDVTLGTHTFSISLCYPTFTLENVLAQIGWRHLTAGIRVSPEKQKEDRELIRRRIEKTQLPVVAELGHAYITVKELLELKEGDVIKLDTRIDDELRLIVGERPKFAVRPGVLDGKRAVRILRELTSEDLMEE